MENSSTKSISAKPKSMSTNEAKRVLASETGAQIESPTLLSKLEQLESQMKLAFPSARQERNPPEIKLPKQPSSQPNKPATQSRIVKGDNKENVNEKSISAENKMGRDKQLKSANSEPKSPTPLSEQGTKNGDGSAPSNKPIIKTNVTEQNPAECTSALPLSPQATTSTTPTVNSPPPNTPNATANVNTGTAAPIKHVSAWKRVSKTLSTMEVIRVMKSRTAASAAQASSASTATTSQPQQSLRPKGSAEGLSLKKSASGTLAISESHHLNSPSTQIKRRSQEEVSSGLSPNSPRLSSSCQTSIHNLNEATKTHASSLHAALSNLSGTGTFHHQIPDNYNTNLINQLNKNYLKNIQKQKARSDWKSLKSKLIGLAKSQGEDGAGDKSDTPESLTTPSTNLVGRKLSNSAAANQAAQSTGQSQGDDGIICKKEDLIFLLRNSNLMNKQRRSNKPSMADVVKQLQESKQSRKGDSPSAAQQLKDKTSLNKNQSDSNESLGKPGSVENQTSYESAPAGSLSKAINSTGPAKGKQGTSNGRVQFVLSSATEPATPTNSAAPVTKIKSSLKKTSSSASGSLDKGSNNLVRQTKSNTINNSNLYKKKVKIFETDQDGIRKALMLQSMKDRNNNENLLNEGEEKNDESQMKINKEDLDLNVQHQKLKWDEQNEVDAGLLGDAIQAFLSTITTNAPTTNASTFSTSKTLSAAEKKVSFKK